MEGYYFLDCENVFGIATFILVRKDILTFSKPLKKQRITFGSFGFPNKGALLIQIQIWDTVIVFINCHLPSGETKEMAKNRADKCDKIIDWLTLHCGQFTDLIFWAGDFNFRCFFNSIPPNVAYTAGAMINLIKGFSKNDELSYYPYTQLSKHKFCHPDLTWLPSYKIDLKSETLLYAKKRTPSWTDRIFYRTLNSRAKITNSDSLIYKSEFFRFSDHMYINL